MYWPEPRDTCSVCQIRPATRAHIYFCARCNHYTNRAVVKALARTGFRLLPELLALIVILAVLPSSGQPNFWLIIPVALLSLPMIRYVFARTARRSVDRYIERSGMAHVWRAKFEVERARGEDAYVRNAIRREAIALAIPLTPELKKALSGQRHPRDLSDQDIRIIWPAVEAAMKRERDQKAASASKPPCPAGTTPPAEARSRSGAAAATSAPSCWIPPPFNRQLTGHHRLPPEGEADAIHPPSHRPAVTPHALGPQRDPVRRISPMVDRALAVILAPLTGCRYRPRIC